MTIQLLPCPFCGGEAAANTVKYSAVTVREQQWPQAVYHGVNCIACGANSTGIVGSRTPEEAAERWNRRA